MKKILAIIRDECTEKTKTALETIGIKGVTFLHVTGRGEQRGSICAPDSLGALRRDANARLLAKPDMVPEPEKQVSEVQGLGKLASVSCRNECS